MGEGDVAVVATVTRFGLGSSIVGPSDLVSGAASAHPANARATSHRKRAMLCSTCEVTFERHVRRVEYRMNGMCTRAILSSARGPAAFWALAGLALVTSHNVTFLVQMGPGQSLVRILRDSGHGYWGLASLALLGIAVGVAIFALLRLRKLRRRARELNGARPRLKGRTYRARAASCWIRLFAVVGIAFLVQENLEHLGTHQHVPALGALLGPEYPLALPVMAVITLLGGLIGAAIVAVERELIAMIDAAQLRFAHAPRRISRPPIQHEPIRLSPLARAAAGRAPPSALRTYS